VINNGGPGDPGNSRPNAVFPALGQVEMRTSMRDMGTCWNRGWVSMCLAFEMCIIHKTSQNRPIFTAIYRIQTRRHPSRRNGYNYTGTYSNNIPQKYKKNIGHHRLAAKYSLSFLARRFAATSSFSSFVRSTSTIVRREGQTRGERRVTMERGRHKGLQDGRGAASGRTGPRTPLAGRNGAPTRPPRRYRAPWSR
jgi:hypothetical protein